MHTSLLKFAINKHFTERGRVVLKEEVDKLLDDWQNVLKDDPHNEIATERIAVISILAAALNEKLECGLTAATFGITTEITTNYIPTEDITIVWKHCYIYDECIDRSIVGFYYGEPDPQSTETFSFQSTTAEFLY